MLIGVVAIARRRPRRGGAPAARCSAVIGARAPRSRAPSHGDHDLDGGGGGIRRKSGLINDQAGRHAVDAGAGGRSRAGPGPAAGSACRACTCRPAAAASDGEIELVAISREDLRRAARAVGATPEAVRGDRGAVRKLSARAPCSLAALTAGQVGVLVPLLAALRSWIRASPATMSSADVRAPAPGGAAAGYSPRRCCRRRLAAGGRSASLRVRRLRGRAPQRPAADAPRPDRAARATVAVARVRAVLVVEGALRRPFRLATLRMEVIGHARSRAAAQALYPLLRRAEVRAFLDRAPARTGRRPRRARCRRPRRALRRCVLPPAARRPRGPRRRAWRAHRPGGCSRRAPAGALLACCDAGRRAGG